MMLSQGAAGLQQNRAGACTLERRMPFLCNPEADALAQFSA
jgi:hypothetical protein